MGRGSFVFFNQASMFYGPETGFDTLREAGRYGQSQTTDFPSDAREAFTDMARFFPTPGVPTEVSTYLLGLHWTNY
jgi:hypothetical protein